jgi:hypothetical protein
VGVDAGQRGVTAPVSFAIDRSHRSIAEDADPLEIYRREDDRWIVGAVHGGDDVVRAEAFDAARALVVARRDGLTVWRPAHRARAWTTRGSATAD